MVPPGEMLWHVTEILDLGTGRQKSLVSKLFLIVEVVQVNRIRPDFQLIAGA